MIDGSDYAISERNEKGKERVKYVNFNSQVNWYNIASQSSISAGKKERKEKWAVL